jgi:hypothetical protein
MVDWKEVLQASIEKDLHDVCGIARDAKASWSSQNVFGWF